MPVLTLDYRHCDRKRPKYIKHIEIEAIAALARQQLVGGGVDAIAFDTLRQIERLKINGIDFALEVSAEWRQQISGPWGAVAFVDAGAVGEDSYPGTGDLRVGVGAGLRYLTAIGPIRVDIGVPLTSDRGDTSYALYVGIGQAF